MIMSTSAEILRPQKLLFQLTHHNTRLPTHEKMAEIKILLLKAQKWRVITLVYFLKNNIIFSKFYTYNKLYIFYFYFFSNVQLQQLKYSHV